MQAQTLIQPDAEPEDMIAYTVAQNIVQLVIKGSLPGQERETIDPDRAIDGVLMGLAMLLEQAREFPTNQALRKGAEEFGKRIAVHAKILREFYDETGVHPIDAFVDRGFGNTAGAQVN